MNFLYKKALQHKLIFGLVLGIVTGSVVTWLILKYLAMSSSGDFYAIRESDKSQPLIHPLLAYSTPETPSSSFLKDTIKKDIDAHIASNDASVISVYYRDLNNGHWFGINQDDTFIPASLFKVPLMITYLKDAEKNQDLLVTKIYNNITVDENKNETIKPIKTITEGESYTVEELLRYMIEYSDNNATVLLFNHSNKNTLQEVFSDLNIQVPSGGVNTDFISVGNYSFFFRVLYNATYLSHEMSEKGLELLSKIDFEDGIRKVIPVSTPVADKFGEYYLIENGVAKEHQLHDCGIVYHPKHPYIICIMTKGDSLDSLKKVLQDISKIVYINVDAMK